jgi:hypothetical protein
LRVGATKKKMTNMACKIVCAKEDAGMILVEMQVAPLAIGFLFDPEKIGA